MEGQVIREEEACSATRRRGAERAETRNVFVLWIVVSCGNDDQDEWRTELDLGGSEPLDDHHRSTALGTEPKIARTIGG